jgi:Sulfotransferase domain
VLVGACRRHQARNREEDKKTVARARTSSGLPSFIVIGAMKSGTSSLYHYLRQHPEVCMSSTKETDFFIEGRNYGKGLDWYRSLFTDHDKVCGEASPNYSKRHRHRGVPARLRQIIPDARLIYILRDPVDRIVSHYLHNRALGRERRGLAEAVAAKSYRNNYVRTSMYQFQLSAFARRFPLERILVVTTEELKDEQARTLRNIFRFIGVEPDFEGSDYGRLFNQTPVAGPAEGDWNGAAVDLPAMLPGQVGEANGRPFLESGLRDRLAECLAPDLEQLRALTGLRFERWRL